MVSKSERQLWYYEKTVKMFSEAGCPTVETEYKSAKERWRYKCECGNIKTILPDDFKRGRRCKECGELKLVKFNENKIKKSLEDAIKYFKDKPENLIKVSHESCGKSKNATVCYYKCENGHEVRQHFNSFRKGHKCKKCASINAGERYRLDIEDVRKEFEDFGCKLISDTYINMDLPLLYECSCGKESIGYLSQIRKGIKCGCGVPKGKDHRLWKSEITEEERLIKRNYPDYKEWVKNVYIRDSFTCQRCLMVGGKLNAHHILAYSTNKELRTDISNGITLCECCHFGFHKAYGYTAFTENSLIEYILSY